MLLALALAASCCAHDRANIELADALRAADFVVGGEVVRVVSLPYLGPAPERCKWIDEDEVVGPDFKVAEIAVERVVKGERRDETLLVRADALFLWDDADVRLGQRGLFFVSNSTRFDWLPQHTAGEWTREFGARPLRELVWGDIAFLENAKEADLLEKALVVTLPKDLPIRREGYKTLVDREVLASHLAALVVKQSKPLFTLEHLWSESDAPTWKLEFARDGRATLADGEFKVYGLFALEKALTSGWFGAAEGPVRVRGPVRATFALTLHSKRGPLAYTIEVVPDAPSSGEPQASMDRLWTALLCDFDSSLAPQPIRSALGLRAPR